MACRWRRRQPHAIDATANSRARRYKKLTKLVVTLNNHPKIKKWNAAKNPKLPWYEPEN